MPTLALVLIWLVWLPLTASDLWFQVWKLGGSWAEAGQKLGGTWKGVGKQLIQGICVPAG